MLLDLLGKGGTGEVYLAEDLILRKKWAVKKADQYAEVLRHEADILKRLEYPLIPGIIDFFEEEENLYLVMDYLEGDNLGQMLKRGERFTEKEVLRIGFQIAEILHYLHTRTPPVLYRDMKPDNILLMDDGKVYLIDFGMSYICNGFYRPIKGGTRLFSLEQQCSGEEPQPGQDLYALGVTLRLLCEQREYRSVERIIHLCTKSNSCTTEKLIAEIGKKLESKRRYRYLIAGILSVFLVLSGSIFSVCRIKAEEEKIYVQYLNRARNSFYERKSDAEELYEKAIRMNPSEISAYLELLQLEVYQGNTEKGIRRTEELIKRYHPKQREQWNRKTGILYLMGNVLDYEFGIQYGKAKEYLRKGGAESQSLAELAEELSKFSRDISWNRVAEILEQLEKEEQDPDMKNEKIQIAAGIWIDRSEELEAYHQNPLQYGIGLLENEIKNTGGMAEKIQMRFQYAEGCYRIWSEKGGEKWKVKAMEQYEKLKKEELSLKSEQIIYKKEISVYMISGDLEAAENCGRKWVEKYPADLEGRCSYIEILFQQGKSDEAKKQLSEVEVIPGAVEDRNYKKLKEKMEMWI